MEKKAMFVGREKELRQLKEALSNPLTKATLVYGRRRMGKTTLIREALKDSTAVRIMYRGIVQASSKTISDISILVSRALSLGDIAFPSFEALFAFMGSREEKFVLVLDEYQDTRKLEKEGFDALLRNAMEDLPENIHIIISGSSIRVMEALTKNDNPLYGRFKTMIFVGEMDYYDSAKFYPSFCLRDKIILYSVFGGIPWINESIDPSISVEENITRLMLEDKGLARVYAEDVVNVECSPIMYSTEVFNAIGNGKRRFSEIQSYISLPSIKTQLATVLDKLMESKLIIKRNPINNTSRKSMFYEIGSNVIRFYFSYIGVITDENTTAKDLVYKASIAPSLDTFVSYRFEDIVRSYFLRLVMCGVRKDILRIGSYWYDDKVNRRNGEFDVALALVDGSYEIHECKFLKTAASKALVLEEKAKVDSAPLVGVRRFGLVSSSGFDCANVPGVDLVSGEDLYSAAIQACHEGH